MAIQPFPGTQATIQGMGMGCERAGWRWSAWWRSRRQSSAPQERVL